MLYLFTTTVHTGVLGALLTFASHPWYSAYAFTAPEWSLAPLEDQQIGGLIMWVPASLVYVGVGLALLARWIESSDGHAPFGESGMRRAADGQESRIGASHGHRPVRH